MAFSKNWCFTLNNYTEEDVERLSVPIDGVNYLIFGKEVGESGTPHIQGTVCFQTRKRLASVISTIGQAHLSTTRFISKSIEYCKKDGDFVEWGVAPQSSQGKRCDLQEFKASVKDGVTDIKTLRDLHSKVCAKYPRFVREFISDCLPVVRVEPHPLRDWQACLNAKLNLEPDKRKIIFIIDSVGDKGKSWFARYYCDMHDNAQIIVPGKKADMAYIISETTRVFFLDCPRSKQGDYIQYDFLEEMKNGYIFSGKYESCIKKIKVPHVVVLMNEYPDKGKLSGDRYDITELN